MKTTLPILLASGRHASVTLPARYAVCPDCQGRGSRVNPAIDGHGLGAEAFEDDDFRQAYFSGAYDVNCQHCQGLRVVAVPDESRLTRWQTAKFALFTRQQQEAAREAAQDARTRRAENGWRD